MTHCAHDRRRPIRDRWDGLEARSQIAARPRSRPTGPRPPTARLARGHASTARGRSPVLPRRRLRTLARTRTRPPTPAPGRRRRLNTGRRRVPGTVPATPPPVVITRPGRHPQVSQNSIVPHPNPADAALNLDTTERVHAVVAPTTGVQRLRLSCPAYIFRVQDHLRRPRWGLPSPPRP